MSTLVLYHANCTDGFGAAYAAWRKFGDEATYVPVQYGERAPANAADVAGKDIYILDFSYTPEEVFTMAASAKSITLLDHHKTAMDKWAELLDDSGRFTPGDDHIHVHFDMTRSGAWMAWDHFHPGAKRPALIQHVGDRDLWLFEGEHTKAFCAGLAAEKKDFDTWHRIVLNAFMYDEVVAAGRAILQFQQEQIDKAANGDLRLVMIDGKDGLASNVTNNVSEVGNAIAKRSGTYSLTFFIKGNEAICSLRSIAPYDCTPIAKAYGGGGHAQAAGFKLPVTQFFAEVWGA